MMVHRVPVVAMVVLFAFAAVLACGDKPEIFTLTDPRGDDHGDGTLRYPMRPDLQPGDLDLIRLTASPDPEGTIFEAVFARTVARAGRQTIDQLGGALQDTARFGFYTMNIDVYIDTDRVAGSGRTDMLPGRRAEVDPSDAWEKVVCLTPRPYDARGLLERSWKARARRDLKQGSAPVDPDAVDQAEAKALSDAASIAFFPTRITVTGSSIRFLVPTAFLGGAAKAEWSYVVAVTAADIQQKVDLGGVISLHDSGPDRLMNLPIGLGLSKDFLGGGREEDDLEPPLLDVVVPEGVQQEKVLRDYDLRAHRPVRLPGVVPAAPHPAVAPQSAPASN